MSTYPLGPISDGEGSLGGASRRFGASHTKNLYAYTTAQLPVTTMTGAVNEAMGTSIASAATTDIGAATGNYVEVSGTTTITGLGTIQAGTRRIVRFTGALTLTYNSASLILPGAANITTAAGDIAEFISWGSGNWVCAWYQRADGLYLSTAGGTVSGALAANGGITINGYTVPYVVSKSIGASSGYRKWSDGLIEQWGTASGNSAGSYLSVALPYAFPSVFTSIVTSIIGAGASSNALGVGIAKSGLSAFIIYNWSSYSTSGYYWEAKGY